MARALLPLLWAALVLPSANLTRFDGLPLDTGPELVGLLLLLPLTVSRGLRRHFRRMVVARARAAPAVLVLLGLVAVGGKLALLAPGTHEGFLGCYRFALAPPPTGPCERSFANPWFRHGVTRIDAVIDFDPETWDLGFLNSRHVAVHGRGTPSRPLRTRAPFEVVWQGPVEQPAPWVARVTYVGEVTLRVGQPGTSDAGSEIRLPPRYGATATADVPVPAGRYPFELAYRFDDGVRWPGPPPAGPWATLRLERGGGAEGRDGGALVGAARPDRLWRALAGVVDSAAVLLGATVALGYAVLLRRDWWLAGLVAIAGVAVSRLHMQAAGLPIAFGVFLALLGLALALLGRPWRRRLVIAFFATAYLNLGLVLSSVSRLDMVVHRPLGDPLAYESQARAILETWSLEGGEPVFRYQPGFRYVRFLERLVLGEGDPLVLIAALALLAWAYLLAIARLWPRPAPPWPRAIPFLVGAGLVLALATSTPVLSFVEAPLSEYPTWVLLPLSVTLLFGTRTPRQWVGGGVLGGVAVLCRLNHVPAFLGYLVVFVAQRWRSSPKAVALTLGLVLAMVTLPAVHNRYYGGRTIDARRILSVNRAALAITPSRLAQLPRDPEARREVWDQIRRIFHLHEAGEDSPLRDRFSRLTMWGLQWLWVGTALVVLPRRRMEAGTKALLPGRG
jgi:hypothetical protein